MEIGDFFTDWLAALKPGLAILKATCCFLHSSSVLLLLLLAGRFPRPPPGAVLEETVLLFTLPPFSSGPAGGETTYQGERL